MYAIMAVDSAMERKVELWRKYGEALAMRQKDLPSLLAGQFSNICDTMKSHAGSVFFQGL